MRAVFLGSPEFAVPILKALAADPVFELALVVTQAARGISPVEREATRLGLPVYKPHSLRGPEARAPLQEADADVFIVAAFGLILSVRTLAIPRLGAINVHPSLLPRYRGASPIMAAIACGDTVTGVSLMEMAAGIDTGPVVSIERAEVANDDTTESLGGRLAELAADQARRDIPRWAVGRLVAQPQSSHGASLTRPLTKADGLIDWIGSAEELERHVRAMWPWPRAWTSIDGTPIQIHRAEVFAANVVPHAPGTVLPVPRRIVVSCGEGALELLKVELAGRRAMSASAFLNGRRAPLERFGSGEELPARPPLVVPVE